MHFRFSARTEKHWCTCVSTLRQEALVAAMTPSGGGDNWWDHGNGRHDRWNNKFQVKSFLAPKATPRWMGHYSLIPGTRTFSRRARWGQRLTLGESDHVFHVIMNNCSAILSIGLWESYWSCNVRFFKKSVTEVVMYGFYLLLKL